MKLNYIWKLIWCPLFYYYIPTVVVKTRQLEVQPCNSNVGNPRDREDGASENNQPYHKQLNKEKQEKTQDLTRFDNFPKSSEQGDRVIIESINYNLHIINIRDNTPLYIAKGTRKKRKPETPNSDQK